MMTDDEIDAAIAAIPDCPACLRPNAASRAIYRAGLREAAKIARALGLAFVEPICEVAAFRVADAIEQDASE